MFAFANVNVSYFITTISEVQMPGTVDYDPEPVAIWACGIVLVEMLTKRVPWKSTFDSDYFIWRTNRARSIRSLCYVSFFVCVHDVVCLLPPSVSLPPFSVEPSETLAPTVLYLKIPIEIYTSSYGYVIVQGYLVDIPCTVALLGLTVISEGVGVQPRPPRPPPTGGSTDPSEKNINNSFSKT